jgi:hypothetical protein
MAMARRPETQGELVVDAHKAVEFEVTENDVATGKALKSRECPGNNGICRSLKSAHPALQNREVRVHLSRTFIRLPVEVAKKEFAAVVPPKETGDHVWVRFQNSDELSNQVHSMDRKEVFAPGEYSLHPVKKPANKRRAPFTQKRPAQNKTIRTLRDKVRKWGTAR